MSPRPPREAYLRRRHSAKPTAATVDQDDRTTGQPHLGPGELLSDLRHGLAGDVAGADPLGERIDGVGQVLAGALDLV